MSNVPLPEPHHQSAANFNAPDEPFYTADQMHAHAAAVSAAKDAEIAALRDFVEHVRRNGSTHLAGMAIAVLAARHWNPLTDDGDALRLAATHHMVLDWSGSELHVRFWLTQSPEAPTLTFKSSDCGGDKATIVRAAAEIGRAMS